MLYILGSSIANYPIFYYITFGHISLMLFGISTSLFITATELFLHAKTFDQYNIVEQHRIKIDSDKEISEDWKNEHLIQCIKDDKSGRIGYNLAIFILFCGLFFLITPYNLLVALIVTIFGIGLQIWQVLRLKT